MARPDSRLHSATAVFVGAAALGALHWVDAWLLDGWDGEGVRRGAPAPLRPDRATGGVAVLAVWATS
jgi:hypothetical protein